MRKLAVSALAVLAVALAFSTSYTALADHHEGEGKAVIGKAAPNFSLKDQTLPATHVSTAFAD